MSHEIIPTASQGETPAQASLLAKSLCVLKKRREEAAIAFAATVLAVMVSSANPSPANAELQTGYTATADNNPITIAWGPDSKNVDPGKLAITIGFWTVLIAIGAGELINEDGKKK